MAKKNSSKNHATNGNSKRGSKRGLLGSKRNATFLTAIIVAGVFGLVGVYVVQNSHAATIVPWNCPSNTYEYDPTVVKICVKQIQSMVNAIDGSRVTVDGRYGTQTVQAVQAFQNKTDGKYPEIFGATGTVFKYPTGNPGDWSTWRKLCGYYVLSRGRDDLWLQTGCNKVPMIP